MGEDAVHDASGVTYVGKVMRWSKPDIAGGSRYTIAEYIILSEDGDRMLVYVTKHDKHEWMSHARLLVGKAYMSDHRVELVDP